MQPWVDKSGYSGQSSIHYDRNLSYLNQYESQRAGSSSSGFRTQSKQPLQEPFTSKQNQTYTPSHIFSPIPTQDQHTSLDGADVLNLLNSTSYSDAVHSDDLNPDSMTYLSHRHQVDTQHGLAELQKLKQWKEFLLSDDIVGYLANATYIEDIYGVPVIGDLIQEAKEEVAQDKPHKAVERLNMIRLHLVHSASGDANRAAKQAASMKGEEWSKVFTQSL
ncbi:hypothetical protein K501DRAFT_281646 [Backusella circina FSU 941]|nr:hypothetical protein K501DRAFT_281646 [Backusella circina FSU 941]